MKLHDIALDNATTRLIAAARATQTTEGIPAESARTLVATARGVRLYLEASLPKLAIDQLDAIDKLMATCEDEGLKEAYAGLVSRCRTHLTRWAR